MILTIQQKIDLIIKELNEIQNLIKESAVSDLENKKNKKFNIYENDIWVLRCENHQLKTKIQELENKLKNIGEIKNIRGAGRKSINKNKSEEILNLRKQGCKLHEISQKLGISISTVNRILSKK